MSGHYLDFSDLTAAAAADVLARAVAAKAKLRRGERPPHLSGRLLMMIFEQASTRTRTSFAAAMTQMGGQSTVLDIHGSQLSRGESIADTARAISGMCDAVMIRARRHQTILDFAAHSVCPVINGLSDRSHPCQVLADIMTFQELRGSLGGRKIAWIGDCNNVLFSWAQAAAMFGAELHVACPPQYRQTSPPDIILCDTAQQAAKNADLLMTDVWASMGSEEEVQQRRAAFADYSVNAALMQIASPQAIFMHCLPAHRGEEVSAEVIDGNQSAVWAQAENRLHAQKALLQRLMLPAAD